MNSIKLIFIFLILSMLKVSAQHEGQTYFSDPNPVIRERSDQWQDIKIGLLMHWGIVES